MQATLHQKDKEQETTEEKTKTEDIIKEAQ